MKSSSEISRDIYGNHAGSFYEFAFTEATGKSNFYIKLFFLKEKWELLCLGFYECFK